MAVYVFDPDTGRPKEVLAGNGISFVIGAGDFTVVANGYNLDELLDVEISGSSGGDVLTYDAADGKWKNLQPAINEETIWFMAK